MKTSVTDIPVALLLLLFGSVLHWWLTHSVLSYTPLPLLVSLLFTWNLSHPKWYLVGLSIAAELFSTLPLGIMTAVIWLPLLGRKLRGLTVVDFSGTFAVIIAGTALLQVILVVAYDLVRLVLQPATETSLRQALPWWPLVLVVGATTIFTFLVSIIRNNQPGLAQSDQRSFRLIPHGRYQHH